MSEPKVEEQIKNLDSTLNVPQLSPTSTIVDENYDGIRLDAILVYAVCTIVSSLVHTDTE